MASAGTFEYNTTCPVCGEPLTVTATPTSDRSGRVFVQVDTGSVTEHICPELTEPYDGILSALS
jgi:hypothetical protein